MTGEGIDRRRFLRGLGLGAAAIAAGPARRVRRRQLGAFRGSLSLAPRGVFCRAVQPTTAVPRRSCTARKRFLDEVTMAASLWKFTRLRDREHGRSLDHQRSRLL
jgi:hypothetical protein